MVRVPTLQKKQILGARGAGQIEDPNLARQKGDVITGAGQIVSSVAMAQKEFDAKVSAANKNLALKGAANAFKVFKADFEDEVFREKTKGKDYRKLYETRYAEFANEYLSGIEDNTDAVRTTLDSAFANGLENVRARGNKKIASDIAIQSDTLNKQSIDMLRRNPSDFQNTMLDVVENTMARVESGELKSSYAEGEITRLSKEAALSTVDGYLMQRNYAAARQFVESGEIGSLLGREDQGKLFDEIDQKQAQRFNTLTNREDHKYKLEMRQMDIEQNKTFFETMGSITHVSNPAQYEEIEKKIIKLGMERGLTKTQATGLLSELDSGWQEIDATNEFSIAQTMTDANTDAEIDDVENSIAEMAASKKLMPQTATKWQNVIRGLRNRTANDPRFKKEYSAFKDKLEGRLPGKDFINLAQAFDPKKIMAADIIFDYNMASLKHSPAEAYKMALQKYKVVELKSGVVSNLTGQKLDTTENIQEHMRMLQNIKESPNFDSSAVREAEGQAVSAQKLLQTDAELNGMNFVDDLVDVPTVPDYNENIQIPFRRK